VERAPSLPYASRLCGACADVCPVKLDIPQVLVHLRGEAVARRRAADPERLAMRALAWAFSDRARFERAQRLARLGRGPLARLPGPLSGWTATRDLPAVPTQSFREWWRGGGA
jgi:L-lactate dehydrogenase complex protein LldF